MWARVPEVMAVAVEQHHLEIRKLIRKHNGYEVKTIGDSFMVAFKKVTDGAQFCVDLQLTFYELDWGTTSIDQTYIDLLKEKEEAEAEAAAANAGEADFEKRQPSQQLSADTPLKAPVTPLTLDEFYKSMWNGLRVRIGVHYGMGEVKFDSVTLGYDYYGTVVNTAARVEGVGHGGQILFTAAAYDALLKECGTPVGGEPLEFTTHVDLGPQPLRGLDQPVTLIQLLPASLARRSFPALRLDVEHQAEESASETESDSEHSEFQPEAVAEQLARKWKGAHFVHHQQLLLQHFCFFKTMLSTCQPKYKEEVVRHVGKKWNVNVPSSDHKFHSVKMDNAVMDLSFRVSKSMEAGGFLHDKVSGWAELQTKLHGTCGVGESQNKRLSVEGGGSSLHSGSPRLDSAISRKTAGEGSNPGAVSAFPSSPAMVPESPST